MRAPNTSMRFVGSFTSAKGVLGIPPVPDECLLERSNPRQAARQQTFARLPSGRMGEARLQLGSACHERALPHLRVGHSVFASINARSAYEFRRHRWPAEDTFRRLANA